MYDTGHLKAPSLTHSPTHPIEDHNEEILAWTLGKFNHRKLNNIDILLVLTICTCLSDGSSCLMVSPPVRRRRVRYLTIHVTGGVPSLYDTLAVPYTTLPFFYLPRLWRLHVLDAVCYQRLGLVISSVTLIMRCSGKLWNSEHFVKNSQIGIQFQSLIRKLGIVFMIGFDEFVTGGSINVHMVFEKTEFYSKSRFNYMKLQILYFLESPQC